MKTTVVVAAFEEEELIEESLRSLRDQRVEPDELIVMDSYSQDRTQKIAAEYADRLEHEEPGKLAAKNEGVRLASNEVVLFADADSVYPPDWVGNLSRHFEDPNVVGVSGGNHKRSESIWGRLEQLHADVLFGAAAIATGGYFMDGGSSAVRKPAFKQAGGFRQVRDPNNLMWVWFEEELKFPRRLSRVGTVLTDKEATRHHEARRLRSLVDPTFKEKHAQQVRTNKRM